MILCPVCICRCLCAGSHQPSRSDRPGPAKTWTPGQIPVLPASRPGRFIEISHFYFYVILYQHNTSCCHLESIRGSHTFSEYSRHRSSSVNPTVPCPGSSWRDPEGSERRHRLCRWRGPWAAGSSDGAVHRGRPEGPALQRTAGSCPQQHGLQHPARRSIVLQRQVVEELTWLGRRCRKAGDCWPVHFIIINGWSSQALFCVSQGYLNEELWMHLSSELLYLLFNHQSTL